MNTRTRIAAASLAALAVTATAPGLAWGQSGDRGLAVVKARATAQIDARLVRLTRLGNAITASRTLTDAHQSALQAILDRSTSGLQALRTEIQGDTDVTEARKDAQRIVDDFRIYVLVTPQTHLVLASDRGLAVADRLESNVAPKLKAAIDANKANGLDMSQEEAQYADFVAKVDAAQAALGGVGGAVLPLLPSGYPANQPTLESSRTSVQSARQSLAAAVADAKAIRDEIKAAAGQPSPSEA